MQLVRADALLGGCQQMCRLEPLMQLHMAALKDGADRDGKFAFAGATAPQPGATALDQSDAVKAATARAKRSLRPYNHLQPGDCSRFVMEMRRGKNAHGLSRIPLTRNIESSHLLVKYIIPLTRLSPTTRTSALKNHD
jgi:hypothetical protein